MKYFKKLKVGVCMAMMGAMILSSTAHAKTIGTIIPASTNYKYGQRIQDYNDNRHHNPQSQDERITYQLACRVYKSQILDNNLNPFKDKYIKERALEYIDMGWTIINLKTQADLINEGLQSVDREFFNQGFVAYDNIYNPVYKVYICKCDWNEWESFHKRVASDTWQTEGYKDPNIYGYTRFIKDVQFDSIEYRSDLEVLDAMHVYLRR